MPNSTVSKKARIFAIIQLCIVFTMILWILGIPFLQDLFEWKSENALHEVVIKNEMFADLAENQQALIKKRHDILMEQSKKPFFDKLKRSLHLLLVKTPAFELAWLAFSVVLSILLLKEVDGIRIAIWILPLLALCYAVDNRIYGRPAAIPSDRDLFPTESYLINHYLESPLSANIFEQEQQLKDGWKKFVVAEWTDETPSTDTAAFEKQAQKGQFAFDAARLERISQSPTMQDGQVQQSLAMLGLYFFWNSLFAFTAWRGESKV